MAEGGAGFVGGGNVDRVAELTAVAAAFVDHYAWSLRRKPLWSKAGRWVYGSLGVLLFVRYWLLVKVIGADWRTFSFERLRKDTG